MAEINAAWHGIMTDRKRHYGMFLTPLRKYDPKEYGKYLQYDRRIILSNLREDIKGEPEAVILYEQELADIGASLKKLVAKRGWLRSAPPFKP